MIIGLGNDLVDIRRIEKSMQRFGERFLNRIFTAEEQAKAMSRADMRHQRAGTLAKRFAAKEACFKALGAGYGEGVSWRDMRVENLQGGKPTLTLSGEAKARLERMIPKGMQPRIDLTMADEFPQAQAIVIISAVPKGA